MTDPSFLLKHLLFLTDSFLFKGKRVSYINIYSRKIGNKYVPTEAVGEGISCVDDVARACVLALEIYEFFGKNEVLAQAKKWLTFLEYMQDEEGFLTNFIDNPKGRRKYNITSSYKGGAWWSSRAKWAWAKTYKITKDKKYLDLYFKTKILEEYNNDVASILLSAALEVHDKEDPSYIKNLVEMISSCRSAEGYFLHGQKSDLHLWGYHELEAVGKYSNTYGDKRLITMCVRTVDTLVKDVINNGFYFEYYGKDKKEISPYCVTPFVRGLYEIYVYKRKKEYLELINKCLDWFRKIYSPQTGRCFDWISNGKITTDCGAEASIEAGFCWLRGLKLDLI